MFRWISAGLLLAAIIAVLASCSPMDVVDLFKPSGGVDAELVVGDKTQEVNTQIGNQEAQQIVNNDNVPVWIILFGVAGWLLPTPTTMWKWLVGRFKK
jgi:hypothetical protein